MLRVQLILSSGMHGQHTLGLDRCCPYPYPTTSPTTHPHPHPNTHPYPHPTLGFGLPAPWCHDCHHDWDTFGISESNPNPHPHPQPLTLTLTLINTLLLPLTQTLNVSPTSLNDYVTSSFHSLEVLVLSCLVLSCLVLSCLVLSCQVLSCLSLTSSF